MTAAKDYAATTWDSYIGQTDMKNRIRVHIRAAVKDHKPLPHVMLSGPLGSGKTTMARLIAKELTDPILELKMPMNRRSLIGALDEFPGGVLFLDEVHALSKADQELLLHLLTDGFIQDASGVKHHTSWLTIIAATTERDKVLKTLLSRFAIAPEFVPYTDEELGRIVEQMARMVQVPLTEQTCVNLGKAAGQIPRNAEHLVSAARALLTTGRTDLSAPAILNFCGIDPDGCGELHRRYLKVLVSQRGRAGQNTLAMSLDLSSGSLRDVERHLLNLGYIVYTPSGREITQAGRWKADGVSEVKEYVRR